MFRRRTQAAKSPSCYAMRQKQHDQVIQWAQELINGHGNPVYRKTLKNFLKRSPSGLEKLSTEDRQRLWAVLNENDL